MDPSSLLYCHFVTWIQGELGWPQARVAVALPPHVRMLLGLWGAEATGIAVATAEGVPAPMEFVMRTWNWYVVLLASWATVWVRVLLAPLPGLMVRQGCQ